MTQLEKYIRQMARAERAPVNPEHVAAFADYLRQKRRRRKGLMILIWGMGVIALIFVGNRLYHGQGAPAPDAHEQQIDLTEQAAPDKGHLSTRSTTPGEGDPAMDAQQHSVSGQGSPPSTATHLIQPQSHVASNTYTITTTSSDVESTEPLAPTRPDREEQHQEQILKSADVEVLRQRPPQLTPVSALHDVISMPNLSPGNHSLGTPVRRIPAHTEPWFERRSRFHFGINGAWSLTRPSGSVSGLATGMTYQGGLNADYAISPRLLMGFEAGVSIIDGGVQFRKESSYDELLFRAQSRMSLLETQLLYAYYGGASLRYRLGVHQAELGAQVLYIYGARGDVERITAGADGVASSEKISNTWVVTAGMQRYPVDLLAGYRLAIGPAVALSVRARIPVISFDAVHSRDDHYLYSGTGYGVAPQIGLYYRIR